MSVQNSYFGTLSSSKSVAKQKMNIFCAKRKKTKKIREKCKFKIGAWQALSQLSKIASFERKGAHYLLACVVFI